MSPREPLPSRWLIYTPPLLMVALVLFSMLLFNRAEDTRSGVRRIDRVRLYTVRALSDLQDAETGQRGYLLTGREEYLEPYQEGKDSVWGRIDEIGRMTRDDTLQQRILTQLRPIIERRIARLDSAIVARRSGNMQEAIAIVASGRGKQLMDSARALFATMRREESRLLTLGEDRERKDRGRLQFALIIGVVFTAGVSMYIGNRLANDATRHWLMSAELDTRIEMLRAQQGARTSGETKPLNRTTPASNRTIT